MDQSSARIQDPRAPPPSVKVWDNVAFESDMAHDDDLAPIVSVPVLRKQQSSQQRASWASTDYANLRASLPAETRRSQPGSPAASSAGSWASPRPRSPAPGEGRGVSQPGARDPQPPHRLSQMGYAPSPSSRVSAAGSEIYPLTQLFGRASASCSPTGSPTIQHLDDMGSNVSSIDEEEGPTTTAGSRTVLPSSKEVLAWQSRITGLLSSSREEALRTPAPAQGLARFYITRHKGGLLGMQCTFRMFLEDGDVEVMSAVKSKQLAREGPTYTLYHAGETPSGRKDGSCTGIAQLAPNSTGTQYQLRALRPSSPKSKSKASGPEDSPELQLCISFEEQATRSELRSMHCLLPCDGDALPQGKDARGGARMAMLCTRQPDYDDANGYTLPIDNRFFVTSVKNFQMVRLNLGSGARGNTTLLQFGRIAGDRFALDFASPLTMKTAFATALAAMEAKYMNSSK